MKQVRKFIILLLVLMMSMNMLVPFAAASETESTSASDEAETDAEIISEEESFDNVGTEEQTDETSEEISEEAPTEDSAAAEIPWVQPGNSDINILSGGTMLSDGAAFYYSDGGIYCQIGDEPVKLSGDRGRNLNLCGQWLYYTVSEQGIKRLSIEDCSSELIYECSGIEQLYVMGAYFCYLRDGCVYAYNPDEQTLQGLPSPENTLGFIPTKYGFIYLSGDAFSYNVWVNGSEIYSGIESCYTDGDTLVVQRDGTYQIALADLFSGQSTLYSYELHQDEAAAPELSLTEQLDREAAFLESELYAQIESLTEGNSVWADNGENADEPSEDGTAVFVTAQQKALSDGNMNGYNIARRGRQMAEVQWTALAKLLAWGGGTYRADRTVTSVNGVTTNYFEAGETYQGIPYSQPVSYGIHDEAAYVGWNLSISDYVQHANDSESLLYTSYSVYGCRAPYYGTDCSGFVSWAWDLPNRCTCSSLVYHSSYIGSNINQLQLGDCLNCTWSHVVLVTDIGYDQQGNIIAVEITEQTPLKMKVTNYGAVIPGKSNSEINYVSRLSALQQYYLNNSYVIYRRSSSDAVTYTPDPSVPLEEDAWLKAPGIRVKTADDGKSILVTLSQDDGAVIHYTTDGTEATLQSAVYTEPISVTKTTVIHAVADYKKADAPGSFQLAYVVEVKTTAAPSLNCVSGDMEGTVVSQNSILSLISDENAVIYYTKDGTEPTFNSSKLGTKKFTITKPLTIKAFAVVDGCLVSKTVSFSISLGSFHKITTEFSGSGTVSPSGTVSVLNGSAKSFSFTPADNYSVYDVKVDGKSVGAVKSYKFSTVTKDHTISVIFSTALPFTDVSFSSWYADEVAFVYEKGLFNGTSSTAFSPNGKMTRGMFATVLGRFAGLKGSLENFSSGTVGFTNGTEINVRAEPSTDSSVLVNIAKKGTAVKYLETVKDDSDTQWYKISYSGKTGYIKSYYNGKQLLSFYTGGFKDISGRYYCGYIQWAQFNGLVSGVSASAFAPDNNITRQDICVILYNYLTKYRGLSLSGSGSSFTDEADISSYASTAVHALAGAGVVNGYPAGDFAPKKTATRAEVAAIFMRLYNYLNS